MTTTPTPASQHSPLTELLPCPFCGGDAGISKNNATNLWDAYCYKCTAELSEFYEKDGAIEAWNGRHTDRLVVPSARAQAARDVFTERVRQVEQEGWTPTHDDQYAPGTMARAAACYALHDKFSVDGMPTWPWPLAWWKPTDARRDLIKAGALILAEIECLDRMGVDIEGEKA